MRPRVKIYKSKISRSESHICHVRPLMTVHFKTTVALSVCLGGDTYVCNRILSPLHPHPSELLHSLLTLRGASVKLEDVRALKREGDT